MYINNSLILNELKYIFLKCAVLYFICINLGIAIGNSTIMKILILQVLLVLPILTFAQTSAIDCDDSKCQGKYEGPEFVNGSDIAHQFSNKMSHEVGNKLKELYNNKQYRKVDFNNIDMTTKGMGSGKVTYELTIPFMPVETKCEAYTSFDHCGGWNHTPELERRKKELQSAVLKGKQLYISLLKTTPEGLQEYWIQWQNKTIQADCE
jgi:hypothetical protein